MLCPYCLSRSGVANSRSHNVAPTVWRRRKCKSCAAVWTTIEKIELSTTHRVRSMKTNRLQQFQQDKLYISIWKALQHRKQPTAEATALTDTIVAKVLAKKSAIIESSVIQKITIETLGAFDPIAASVYSAQTS